jgi:lipid II:glycine glycyltransferase (peptidoglycan interpeptide bridge formation enzyme)
MSSKFEKICTSLNYDIVAIEPQDHSIWDEFVSKHDPSNLLQSFQWGEFKHFSGKRIYRIALVDENAIQAVAQIYIHESFPGTRTAHLEYGPILASSVDLAMVPLFVQEICRFVRQQVSCTSLIIEKGVSGTSALEEIVNKSVKKLKGRGCEPTQPHRTIRVDLSRPEADLLAGFKEKTRYNIRLAEKKGVAITFSREKFDLDRFLHLLSITAKRQHVSFYPKNYFETLWDVYSHSGQIVLGFAQFQGIDVASLILVLSGNTAYYLFGGTADEHRDCMANYLLHYQAMLLAKEGSYSWYDFWGSAKPGDKTYEKWKGITRFKEGFNGHEIEFGQAYSIVFRRFPELVHSALQLPLDLYKRLRK